jgi:hypothetical protein
MWEEIQRKQKNYLKDYKKKQRLTIDEIQNVVDSNKLSVDELYDIADTNKINKFKRKITATFDEIKNVDKPIDNSYVKFLADTYLNSKQITNKDILLFLIMLEYLKLAIRLNDYELFSEIVSIAHKHAENECKQVLGQDKKTRPINVLNLWLMTLPNHLGSIWSDYIQNEINYNANQLFKQIMIDISQNNDIDLNSDIYKNIFDKQQRTHFNINEDKYSGGVDAQSVFIANQTILEVGKDYGMEKVMFISDLCGNVTKMCKNMHKMVFNLKGQNIFDRWYGDSANDLKEVIVDIDGLVLGINLPPITGHFHWCHSTLTYLIDEDIVDETSKKLLEMNRVAQEQYNRYKKYFGDEIPSLKEFIEIRRNNPKEWERLKKVYFNKRREYKENN